SYRGVVMDSLFNLFISAVFVENLALSFFLGMCTFLAISKQVSAAFGLGVAVVFIQTITVPVNHLIYYYLLRDGALAWAGMPSVKILEMFLAKHVPASYNALGVYMTLITVNCAILGGTLFMVERDYNFAESVTYAIGTGVGWALAITTLAGIRERLKYSDIPA